MRIETDGIQINCEVSGKKGSPVVVMSHSLGSAMNMWNPQLDVLEPPEGHKSCFHF